MTNEHWRYFLALEQDVERMTRFVEPHPSNYGTFSIEFARILLSACSEVDVVAKVICHSIASSAPASNIDQYRTVLQKQFPHIHEAIVEVPRFGLQFEPWKEWGTGTNPKWWTDYQLVKHHRHKNFESADLEHCLLSTAGLFVLTLYLCRDERIGLEHSIFFKMGALVGKGGRYPLPDEPR